MLWSLWLKSKRGTELLPALDPARFALYATFSSVQINPNKKAQSTINVRYAALKDNCQEEAKRTGKLLKQQSFWTMLLNNHTSVLGLSSLQKCIQGAKESRNYSVMLPGDENLYTAGWIILTLLAASIALAQLPLRIAVLPFKMLECLLLACEVALLQHQKNNIGWQVTFYAISFMHTLVRQIFSPMAAASASYDWIKEKTGSENWAVAASVVSVLLSAALIGILVYFLLPVVVLAVGVAVGTLTASMSMTALYDGLAFMISPACTALCYLGNIFLKMFRKPRKEAAMEQKRELSSESGDGQDSLSTPTGASLDSQSLIKNPGSISALSESDNFSNDYQEDDVLTATSREISLGF